MKVKSAQQLNFYALENRSEALISNIYRVSSSELENPAADAMTFQNVY